LPSASEDVAARLREGPVRITGSGSRDWGPPTDARPLSTSRLDRIVDHQPGDFTAVLEAGVALADAQAAFAEAGQMLALDPPRGGTIGGLVATADSGPLRHRYGAPRDLVIGVALALSDGTVARGGGRVIKNVAGYDLPKLAAGSYGTLGVITEVAVRLHPRPGATATAVLTDDDPGRLQQQVLDLARKPLEAEALDVRWADGEGAILVRFGGAAATDRARRVGGETVEDDDELWEAQRSGQRGELVVRVHHLPTDLARVLRAAPRAVGRAAVGTTWVHDADVEGLRRELAPNPCVLLDAPAELRARADPFGIPDGPERALMRRVKERFDPAGHCNPGLEP
jgi:glycolate dehydrogenase FAD-binding subunit